MNRKEIRSLNKAMGETLRARRKIMGKSLMALAKKLGMTYQQLQKYEAGANTMSVPRALQICQALDLDITDLVGDSGSKQLHTMPLKLSKNFNKLSEEGKNSVISLVRSLANQKK